MELDRLLPFALSRRRQSASPSYSARHTFPPLPALAVEWIPRTTKSRSAYSSRRCLILGSCATHGPHQLPQKSIRTTLPCRSERDSSSEPLTQCDAVILGAGSPSSSLSSLRFSKVPKRQIGSDSVSDLGLGNHTIVDEEFFSSNRLKTRRRLTNQGECFVGHIG